MSAWGWEGTPLRALDALLALLGLLLCAWAARAAGPAGSAPEEVFLGGRRLPWWAAGLALLSAEVSAVTLVAVPAAAFTEGLGLAQFFLGSLLGRAACGWLLPRWRQGGATTVYSVAGRSLGAPSAAAGAALFCAGRGLASAMRLVGAALALSLLTGLGPGWWALLLCAGAAAVIGYGGLRAVVWTSVLQAAVVLGAGAILLVYVLLQTPGHFHGVLAAAHEGGRLTFADAGSPWLAWLVGAAGALASFGADYELSQKLLCCRSDRDARRALALATGLTALLLAGLLALGLSLWAFYEAHPALAVPARLDKILPHFAATVLPASLRGLVFLAVLLAALDLPLSSLTAAAWRDLGPGKAELTPRARWGGPGAAAAALFVLSLAMLADERAARLALGAWPVVSGPLLALTLAAALRRGTGWAPPLAAGAGLWTALLLGAFTEADPGWLTPVGAAVSGSLLWLVTRPKSPARLGGRPAEPAEAPGT